MKTDLRYTLFFLVSYLYFYNLFIFLPNYLISSVKMNLKMLFFVVFQGIFLGFLEKYSKPLGWSYMVFLFLVILPSLLFDPVLSILQVLVLLILGFIGLNERDPNFVLIFCVIWVLVNLAIIFLGSFFR